MGTSSNDCTGSGVNFYYNGSGCIEDADAPTCESGQSLVIDGEYKC
jgi:hypothetical protein